MYFTSKCLKLYFRAKKKEHLVLSHIFISLIRRTSRHVSNFYSIKCWKHYFRAKKKGSSCLVTYLHLVRRTSRRISKSLNDLVISSYTLSSCRQEDILSRFKSLKDLILHVASLPKNETKYMQLPRITIYKTKTIYKTLTAPMHEITNLFTEEITTFFFRKRNNEANHITPQGSSVALKIN